MARLHVCSVVLVLFITSGVVLATRENDQIIKENNCEAKMGMPCVWEVFDSIFKTGTVSHKCCGDLVNLGKICHSAFVKRTLENPEFKHLKSTDIIAKSIKTWTTCVRYIHPPSPSS
jgi:Prolamin-like